MNQVVDDPLKAGREASVRGAYREAYDLLSPARTSLGAEDLERLGDAAFWTGRLDEAIELRERAYTAHLDAGDKVEAARVALWVSGDYFNKGDLAISHGWFSKAERLLEGQEESATHGMLEFTKGANDVVAGKLDTGLAHTEKAIELARKHGDRNLESMSMVIKGRGLVLKGEADRGLALLDEATSAAVSGELEPFATGFIYCVTITSCQGFGDYRRAAEWSDAATKWCTRQDVTGFPGACRVHHASIARLRGHWDEAQQQAEAACEELHGYDAWTTAAGFYEIGEIHRRRGEFAEADASYDKAKEWGRDPQPGRALLRLAQGKADEAWASIRRTLAGSKDPVSRIRRLSALVEVAVATGHPKDAREAAEELETLVDGFKISGERTPAFEAMVCTAWGQIGLAENDPQGAAAQLERAAETWRGIKAPYETAQAQVLLGIALRRLGDDGEAREELKAARAQFERLRAALDLQRTRELLGEEDTRRTFMFTDIVDSTKYVELLGQTKWERALSWHDRELRTQIEEHGGDVIKQTGDGYFAAFDSPGAALKAAVAIQRAIDSRDAIAPDVRIGIHTGGAVHRADDDYAGQGVNIAARIGALAEGGQILVSRESIDGSPYPLTAAKTEELKGIENPVELVSVDWH